MASSFLELADPTSPADSWPATRFGTLAIPLAAQTAEWFSRIVMLARVLRAVCATLTTRATVRPVGQLPQNLTAKLADRVRGDGRSVQSARLGRLEPSRP